MGPAERIKRIIKIGLLFSNEISPSVPLSRIYSTVKKSTKAHIWMFSVLNKAGEKNTQRQTAEGTVANACVIICNAIRRWGPA